LQVNSLTAICEASGADISEIAKAIGADSRIGSQFLKAGVGFGGSCFRKDLQGLIYLLEQFHMTNEAAYWRTVLTMNVYQKERFARCVHLRWFLLGRTIISSMFGTIKGKTLCVLGFSFKKDTSDTRDSPAIYVAR
jgi:UDPglucose 6-dehydrogenase